jgi:DNA repair protein RadC
MTVGSKPRSPAHQPAVFMVETIFFSYFNIVKNYENKISIKAWAEEDRPREKLNSQGRRSLTDAELIAILIGSGSRTESAVELSKRILHHYGNDLNNLGKASVSELSRFKGIGEAKAIAIIAALEIGRRRNDTETKTPDTITCSKDTFNIMRRHLMDLDHEEFWIIPLSRSGKVLAKELISKGGLSGTVADPKIIFNIALQHHAASIVMIHNHPSGNLKPSQLDIELTKKIANAGKMLDMNVLDHIIITNDGFYSFADEGVL